MRTALLITIVFGLSCPASAQESVLDRRIKGDEPGAATVWLPDAISSGIFAWRIAESAGIPLVFEAWPLDYRDPAAIAQRIDLAGLTVHEALDTLVAQDSRYRWEERSGTVVIRPIGLAASADDALNQPIAGVRGDRLRLDDVLAHVTEVVQGKVAPATSPASRDSKEFALDVSSGTVLDLLVSAARAHGGVMWSVPDGARGPDQDGFSLGFQTFAGAGRGTAGPAAR